MLPPEKLYRRQRKPASASQSAISFFSKASSALVRASASSPAAAMAAFASFVTSVISSSTNTRAFGPALTSSAVVGALKPFLIRLFSAVEFSWMAP